MKHSHLLALCLAFVAVLLATAQASDGNQCRNIVLYDPYIDGTVHFDLSALIDHGPIKINSTMNGMDWDLWTFSVCKPLEMTCPNTEPESKSVCGQPNVAAMCQQYKEQIHDQVRDGSFCVSSYNGTVETYFDADGERGVFLKFSEGDTREELRYRANVVLNVKCDRSVTAIDPNEMWVQPPFFGSNLYTVHIRHKAGCPVQFNLPAAPKPAAPPTAPHAVPPHAAPHAPSEPKKGGLPGGILALLIIGMLLIGIFAGGLLALWLNSRYAWFSNPRLQAQAQYSQFELDDDI